jgi:putative ABC transport system permease protein
MRWRDRIMISELRQVLRALRRSPGFCIVSVLVMAIGIGGCAAVFSVANVLLLRPLLYPEPERLVLIWEKRAQDGSVKNGVSIADYLDWRAQNQSFAALDAGNQRAFNLTGDGKPERVMSSFGTSQMLATYETRPELGRGLVLADEEGDGHVVLLSYGLWQRRFAGASDVIGKTIHLDDEPYRIAGVLPKGFRSPYGKEPDIYLPWVFAGKDRQDRVGHRLLVIGRLKPGVTLAQAQAELDAISGRLAQAYPVTNAGHGANLVLLLDETTGEVRPALLVLLIAAGFLLLLACANTANLLLARATVREREIAIRMAMGASTLKLIRLLLTESITLALAGGAVGVAIARAALLAMPLRKEVVGVPPAIQSAAIDSRVLLFALALSILTGVVFGLAPILQSARIGNALRAVGRSYSTGIRGHRLRRVLVISEVAIACALTAGAGLLIRSFVELARTDPGFQATHRLTMELSLPRARYQEQARQIAFYDEIARRISALPSVKAAALSTAIPASAVIPMAGFRVEGQPEPRSPEDVPAASWMTVSDGFFPTMGIPVLRGRAFNSGDRLDTPKVALISESATHRYFGDSDPLGKRIELVQTPGWKTIVGVTGSLKPIGRQVYKNPGAEIYLSLSQQALAVLGVSLIVEAAQDPQSLTKAVTAAVWEVDPEIPAGRVRTIEQVIDETTGLRRFQMLLVAVFAGVALVLAAGGLYSVMAYLVTQRTREVGIRIALGAQRGDVLTMVLREGAFLGFCGVVIGTGIAVAAGRALRSFLAGVAVNDPLIFAGVALLLMFVALAASYIPALRAMRLDPAVALRQE